MELAESRLHSCASGTYDLMQPTSTHGLPQILKGWETVPVATLYQTQAMRAGIRCPRTPVCVYGHWQLEEIFAAYEG